MKTINYARLQEYASSLLLAMIFSGGDLTSSHVLKISETFGGVFSPF